jgi:LCP family protein required for cell wall assembly
LWLAALVLSAGLALALYGAFSGYGLYGGQGGTGVLLSESGDAENAASPRGTGDQNAVNILLMGLDGGKDPEDGGIQRADTLMIARMYPDTGEVRLLSIPRDLFVQGVGSQGEQDRINSAYAYGGPKSTVEAVEDFSGIPVDHYVTADFEGFEKTVDSLGGVEVDVKMDYLSDRGIPPGEQVLDGKEALLYARYRKTPRGDLGRVERQQQILAAFRSQVLSWDSITSSPGIIRNLNEHVETDMGIPRMITLGRALAQSDSKGGLESDQLEGNPVTLEDGRQVLIPAEKRNEQILYDFLR